MAIGIAVVLLFVSLGLFQVRWRIPVYLIAGPPALGVFAFGILFPFRPFITTSSFVNEAASMGSYSIVRFHRHWLGPSQIELRVRTHDGLFSRDGEPIACFSGDQLSDPKWTLGGVRFIDEDTIEVSARNGDVMLLDIDAETLTARSGALDRCTNADYPTWDD